MGCMALEHALLIALSEQPASGLDLSRRFERSIGFFWSATHQQIYKVLARMDADGWVEGTQGAPTRTVLRASSCAACAPACFRSVSGVHRAS